MLPAERQRRSVAARMRRRATDPPEIRCTLRSEPFSSQRWLVQTPVVQDPRAYLDQVIRERGWDYAAVSRMIRRNPSYISQFIHRGTPRRLDERDRRVIASALGVPETMLGADPQADDKKKLRKVPRLDVRASAGPGATAFSEFASDTFGFSERWLRDLAHGSPDGLSLIQVQGDSMEPTLSDGDDIMVNRNDGVSRLRDGIYVLRRGDDLHVKRIACSPVKGRISVRSDNPAYPSWEDVDVSTIAVIGRVVWSAGRH